MIDRYTLPEMKALWSEEAKFEAWLQVELAACEAWAARGAIPADALAEIQAKARISVPRIEAIEAVVHHDVIAFTTCLAETIGPAARYVHLGLTSSDVVDTALSLRLVRAVDLIRARLETLLETLRAKAVQYKRLLMVGRTHGIHAEPVTLGLKFLIWLKEMERNRRRLEAARQTIAVGKVSGAVGTYAHAGPEIEREVCRRLGLEPAPVSSQVLQRDRHAELMAAVALTGASVEKIATEIRNLQRTDLGEFEEPFGEGQKGSSAMPHKRNPVGCEQLTGLARLLRAHLLAALENVPLWHERDISHSSVERVILPDSTTLLHYMLHHVNRILSEGHPNPARMEENLARSNGLIYSQRILLALVERGLSREAAYALVQRGAMKSWQDRRPLVDHLLADPEWKGPLSPQELRELMDPNWFLRHLDEIYRQCGVEY